jgi:hypothetical protein
VKIVTLEILYVILFWVQDHPCWSIVNDKKTYGTDINPVAVLITKAKTTPIEPQNLERRVYSLRNTIRHHPINENKQTLLLTHDDDLAVVLPTNKHIDYWFSEKQKI